MSSKSRVSKGCVTKTKKGKWRYEFRVDGRRRRKAGFDTEKSARKAMQQHKTDLLNGTIRERRDNLFWTRERMEHVRDVILPESYSVDNAIQKINKKWKRNISRNYFAEKFKSFFGRSPGKYLGKHKKFDTSIISKLPPDQNPIILQNRISQLEKQLMQTEQRAQVATIIKSELRGLQNRKIQPPNWLSLPPIDEHFNGVPTLLISDPHHAERVFPEQVNHTNEFNSIISRRRFERIFQKTIYLLEQVLSNTDYPGIVLALAGDMLSGIIHGELRETNDMPTFQALIDLADILVAGILLLKERFKKVYVPCVVGNHGRTQKKPKYKYGPHDNYDWMLYQYVASFFDDDDDVIIDISDSYTLTYRLYNTRYLLTHGDQFRGGSGISGPILPWTRGDHKLRKQVQGIEYWTGIPAEYDVLVFGHWHNYFPTRSFIVNGSIKGFDELAMKCQFPFELPQQALWLTHPKYGNTFAIPVYAESAPEQSASDWLSILGEAA